MKVKTKFGRQACCSIIIDDIFDGLLFIFLEEIECLSIHQGQDSCLWNTDNGLQFLLEVNGISKITESISAIVLALSPCNSTPMTIVPMPEMMQCPRFIF